MKSSDFTISEVKSARILLKSDKSIRISEWNIANIANNLKQTDLNCEYWDTDTDHSNNPLSLLNPALWQYTFGYRRRGDRQKSEKDHNIMDLSLNIEDLMLKSMDFTIYKVKSVKILRKSEDLRGFHDTILKILWQNTELEM